MAKRKNTTMSDQEAKAFNENIMRMMHPDLPSKHDEPEPVVTKAEDKQNNQQITELMSKLAALEAQVNTAQRTNAALLTQPKVELPPQRPVVDESKFPDPVDDPKGYAKAVREATIADINYNNAMATWQNNQVQTNNNKLNQLWTQFGQAHGDYAKDQDKVVIAAEQVLRRIKAQGLDPDRYMFGNTNGFMSDVTQEMDKLFGKPKTDATDDAGEDDDDTDDIRTGGMFGGAEAGGKPVGNKPAEKLGSFAEDITAWQQKTGFTR